MTSQGMKRAVNFGLCGHGAGKYFKMAIVESECFEVLSCLLEAIQTNEDPSSFQNSCTGPQRLDNPQNQCSSQLSSLNFTRRWGGAASPRELVVLETSADIFNSDMVGWIKSLEKLPGFTHEKLGSKKTLDSLLSRFYWPGIIHNVSQHCKSCEACQKSGGRKSGKHAHLVSLPIIEPFQKIAMDIVGPLIRSKTGNKFILVMCDYSTKYPEAVPLKNIEAETIAEELGKFFSQMGVPTEILTDQGSNFTSQLLKEVYRMLKIEPIRTSPYHPQTDGLVERTLKGAVSLRAHPGET